MADEVPENVQQCMRSNGYHIVGSISRSGRGIVTLAREREDGGAEHAIKLIEGGSSPDSHERLKRAILRHRSLKHPHIVEFERVVRVPGKIAVVMEHAQGGKLSDYLRASSEGRLDESWARWFLQQVAWGVEYCHRKRVPCGSLNLEKILLKTSPELPMPTLKLYDFGYSELHVESPLRSSVERVAFLAPEVIEWWEADDPDRPDYDVELASVWSCGAILYSLLVGEHAFAPGGNAADLAEEARRHIVIDNIKSLHYTLHSLPNEVDDACRDFISKCLTRAPDRLSFEGMMTDEWFVVNKADKTKGDALQEARALTDRIIANDANLMASIEGIQPEAEILDIIRTHMVERSAGHPAQNQ